MYCPKCGTQNEDNEKFCKGCMAPLMGNEKSPSNIEQNPSVVTPKVEDTTPKPVSQAVQPRPNPIPTATPKRKRNKKIRLLPLIAMLIVGGVVAYNVYFSTKSIIFRSLTSSSSEFTDFLEVFEIDDDIAKYSEEENLTVSSKLKMKIDSNQDAEDMETIKEIYEKSEVHLFTQLSADRETRALDLKGIYNSEVLANIGLIMNEDKTYLDLKDLFDKVIFLEDIDLQFRDAELTEEAERVLEIVEEAIKNEMKSEFFVSSKTEIDGKSVTKNSFILRENQVKDFFVGFTTSIKNNNELYDILSEMYTDLEKEKYDEVFDIVLSYFEDYIEYEDLVIDYSVYTSGLAHKIVEKNFSITDQTDNIEVKIKDGRIDFLSDGVVDSSIILENENNENTIIIETEYLEIKLNITSDTEEISKKKNYITKKKIVLEMKNEDDTTVEISASIDSEYKIGETLDIPNTNDSIKSSELTDEDNEEILRAFLESIEETEIGEMLNDLIESNTTSPEDSLYSIIEDIELKAWMNTIEGYSLKEADMTFFEGDVPEGLEDMYVVFDKYNNIDIGLFIYEGEKYEYDGYEVTKSLDQSY